MGYPKYGYWAVLTNVVMRYFFKAWQYSLRCFLPFVEVVIGMVNFLLFFFLFWEAVLFAMSTRRPICFSCFGLYSSFVCQGHSSPFLFLRILKRSSVAMVSSSALFCFSTFWKSKLFVGRANSSALYCFSNFEKAALLGGQANSSSPFLFSPFWKASFFCNGYSVGSFCFSWFAKDKSFLQVLVCWNRSIYFWKAIPF